MKYVLAAIEQDHKYLVLADPVLAIRAKHEEQGEATTAERLHVDGYLEAGFGGVLLYVPKAETKLYAPTAQEIKETRRDATVKGYRTEIKQLKERLAKYEGHNND